MKKEECIFCKIAEGKIPGVKIWEDNEFLAILSSHPNTEGVTLVLTKKHYDSYVFDMKDEVYKNLMMAAKKVAKILEKGLNVKRIALVMEGMGLNHAHIKLYPLHGLDEKFKKMFGNKEIYQDRYEGYITTLEGPKKTIDELEKVAEKIKRLR
jgi:diadenosine tetraphosphate (Ap4A) HIT family hydrolase